MSNKNNPDMPEGHYAISNDDKFKIQAFGRELTGFIQEYIKKHQDKGEFPYRIILGGFNYYTMIQEELVKAVASDSITMLDLLSKFGNTLEEPFTPETPQTEVEAASPSPTPAAVATPIEPSTPAAKAVPAPGDTTHPAEAVPAEAVPASADGTFDPTLST